MGLLSKIGNSLVKALDTVSGVVTNPVTAITKGVAASTKAYNEAKPITNIVKTVTNVGLAAGAVVGVGALFEGGTAALGKAVQAVIPSTAKGKVIAAVTAPIAVGVIATQPAKSAEAILNAPSSLANFGSNVGNLIKDPSLSNATNIVKENPVISAAVGTAVAVGAGLGIGGLVSTVSNIQNTKAVKENTAATLGGATESSVISALPVESGKSTTSSPPLAVTPQTQTLTATTENDRDLIAVKNGKLNIEEERKEANQEEAFTTLKRGSHIK